MENNTSRFDVHALPYMKKVTDHMLEGIGEWDDAQKALVHSSWTETKNRIAQQVAENEAFERMLKSVATQVETKDVIIKGQYAYKGCTIEFRLNEDTAHRETYRIGQYEFEVPESLDEFEEDIAIVLRMQEMKDIVAQNSRFVRGVMRGSF